MVTEFAIAAFCGQSAIFAAEYQSACNKASEAYGRQVGMIQTFEQVEEATKTRVTKKTGDKVWIIGGMAYKVYQTKTISPEIKIRGSNPVFIPRIITPSYGFDKNHFLKVNWGVDF